MPFGYNSNESFSAENISPSAPGTYAVQRKNDVEDEATWDGEKWSGAGDVKSFSGVPALLSGQERSQHRSNIRAGLEIGPSLPERAVARESALKLARHFAVRLSRASGSAASLTGVRSMVAMFRIARTLGASFPAASAAVSPDSANQVDTALFAWGNGQIETKNRGWFAGAGAKTETIDGVRQWLDGR